jgi:hypothetical protein
MDEYLMLGFYEDDYEWYANNLTYREDRNTVEMDRCAKGRFGGEN